MTSSIVILGVLYICVSVTIGLIVFVSITNFSSHAISVLLFIYICFSLLILKFNLEILTLLLLLIYSGGVMVLFIFCLFFLDSSMFSKQQNKFKFSSVVMCALFLLILSPVIVNFFPHAALINSVVSLKQTEFYPKAIQTLIIAGWLFKPVSGFNMLPLFKIGSVLYISYFFPTLMCFILLIVVLLIIVLVTTTPEANITTKKRNLFSLDFSIVFTSLLEHLEMSPFIFFFGVFGFCVLLVSILLIAFTLDSKNFNLLRFLITLELCLLPIILLLVYFSYLWADLDGIIFCMFLLCIFAAETAIGMSFFSNKTLSELSFKKKNVY